MPDLITRERALRNLSSLSPTATDNLLVDALIAAVSQAVEQHCQRSFAMQRHDERYPGSRGPELLLRHYPVVGVERVANGLRPVLRIGNSSTATQRATVQVTDMGLTLSRVAAGVTATTPLAFTDYTTLNDLATSIVALGSGWSAAVIDPSDSLRPSTDLHAPQGAFGVKDRSADLLAHTRDLASYTIVAPRGCLVRACCWHGGPEAWRVIYVAGFAAVPDDVQEACAEWVSALFWQGRRDPGLAHEVVPGVLVRIPLTTLPATVKTLLAPYRNLRL